MPIRRLVFIVANVEYRVLKKLIPANRSMSRFTLTLRVMFFAKLVLNPNLVPSSCRIPSKS